MSCIYGILAVAVTWQVVCCSSCCGPVLSKEEMQLGCASWLLALSMLSVHAAACSKVESRMRNASRLIREWSKTNGSQSLPAHWCLTRGKLGLKTGKFCHLHGKGWHTTVVLQFLVDFTENKGDADPLLKSSLWSAKNFLSGLQEHRKQSTLLTQEIIQQVLTVGAFFQKCYLRLAVKYKGFCTYLLFNVRPKFHLLTHLICVCEKIRNPLCSSTWMDETWIGQIMKLASKCHKRTMQLTTLQRYCTGQGNKFETSACVLRKTLQFLSQD